MYYMTEIDGFKKIHSEKAILTDQFLTIYDEVYEDEDALYKVKKTTENKLYLGLVKVLPLHVIPEENNVKTGSLYLHEGHFLHTEGKVSKNQTVSYNKSFYIVKDILKQDGPKQLILDKIEYIQATNIYTIYRNIDGNEKVFEQIDNYSKALGRVFQLRGMQDGAYYRFI